MNVLRASSKNWVFGPGRGCPTASDTAGGGARGEAAYRATHLRPDAEPPALRGATDRASRPLKKAHLRRWFRRSSLQRTAKYASLLASWPPCIWTLFNTLLAPESLESLGLTRREGEVLGWVAQGKTNAEIGIIVSARPRTVEKHLERIFGKLGVETRTAAAALALQGAGMTPDQAR